MNRAPIHEAARASLERLGKWRTIFAGWQLGTRTDDDPECQAVRDHRDATMILRVEVSALVNVLIARGIFTGDEYAEQILRESDELQRMYEGRFPGARATDAGMDIDLTRAMEWLGRFPA